MSVRRIEGRPDPDPANPYDQSVKRPADRARRAELDRAVNDQRGKDTGPSPGNSGEARRRNQGAGP